MVEFTIERHIDAPVEKVFDLAADFPNAADRIEAIKRIEMLTDGPVGVGTRFRETRRMFKRDATEEMEVTAFDPPKAYSLGCESCGARYHTEFRFTPKGRGTEVRMTFQVHPLTFLAKAMSLVTRPMMKMCMKETAKDLENLKTCLEEREGSAVG